MRYDSLRYALVNRWDDRHLHTFERLLGPSPGPRVLEVGCGRGHLTKALQNLGLDVTGIDANPQAAAVAVTDGVHTMHAEALEFPDASFDTVVSVHAIEHIPPIEGAFAEMARVVRPGGRILLIYPAEPVQGVWAVPTSVILYRNPFKARRVHCHWLWPSKVRRLAAGAGLEHLHSEFNLFSSPQFVTLLRRPA